MCAQNVPKSLLSVFIWIFLLFNTEDILYICCSLFPPSVQFKNDQFTHHNIAFFSFIAHRLFRVPHNVRILSSSCLLYGATFEAHSDHPVFSSSFPPSKSPHFFISHTPKILWPFLLEHMHSSSFYFHLNKYWEGKHHQIFTVKYQWLFLMDNLYNPKAIDPITKGSNEPPLT